MMIRSLVDETKDVMNPAASIDESITTQDESIKLIQQNQWWTNNQRMMSSCGSIIVVCIFTNVSSMDKKNVVG